jgi:hypothetical protein
MLLLKVLITQASLLKLISLTAPAHLSFITNASHFTSTLFLPVSNKNNGICAKYHHWALDFSNKRIYPQTIRKNGNTHTSCVQRSLYISLL